MSLNLELIKACLSSIRDALIVMDDQGTIEYWNPIAEQIFGYTAAEVRGKYLHDLVAPEASRLRFEAAMAQYAQTGTGNAIGKTLQVDALRRDGSLFPAELSLSTFQDRGRWHSVGVVRDISEQVAAEQRLKKKSLWQETLGVINGQTFHQQSLEQTLTNALISICGTAGAPFLQQGAIFILDRNNQLSLHAAYNLSPAQQQQATNIVAKRCPYSQPPSPGVVNLIPTRTNKSGCKLIGAEKQHYCFPLIDRKQRHRGVLLLSTEKHVQVAVEELQALRLLVNSVTALLDRHSLYEQNQRLRQIIEQNPIAIAITDPQTRFEYVNPQLCRASGYSREELIGNTPRLLSSGETPIELYRELWATINQGKPWHGEIRNRKKNGDLFWESQIIWPVQGDNGLVSYVVLKEDITEKKFYQDQLEKLSTHDLLTGLPNEQLLRDRIEQAIVKAERDNSSCLLCAIDVKQMRLVNESLGLSVGDLLLKEISARLKNLFRKADTLARLSGDTFVLICSTEDCQVIGAKIDALCAEPFVTAVSDIPVEVYSSILQLPHCTNDIEIILQRLTATLNRAKASDSSTPVLYDRSFDTLALAAFSLKNDLNQALSEFQFQMWYQPKVNISTGRVIGAEALIRWLHPERGMVSPLEFIGLAESSGQIIEIGRWVIEEVIRQISVWNELGLFNLPVSLNVSARQLSDPLLLATIKNNLSKYQVGPAQLELELTESVLAEDPLAVRQILNQFADLGLKIALDDFGTGYSSLAYICKLPIHTVKIDQSFVQGVCNDPQSAVIVKSTLSMCRDLGIKTIAEGVETEAQGRFISRHGCQQMQGYLFSKPLPADAFYPLQQQGFAPLKTDDRNEEVVVILDDEQPILNAIRHSLRHSHYKLLLTSSPSQALEWLATYSVGVVITDQQLAEMSGVEFLRKIKLAYPDTSRMILSGYSDLETITQAINEGSVFRLLSKPWEAEDLKTSIDEGFYYYNLRRSLLKKEAMLERIRNNSQLKPEGRAPGMELIETQHAELINKYNLLSDAYFTNSDSLQVITLYNDFTDACRQHFLDEEATMNEALYPEAKAHKRAHDALLVTVSGHGDRLVNDYDSVNQYELICFLKESISSHIKELDLPFGNYFAHFRQEQPPMQE